MNRAGHSAVQTDDGNSVQQATDGGLGNPSINTAAVTAIARIASKGTKYSGASLSVSFLDAAIL